MSHMFEITFESKGFEDLPTWWVSYDESKITWMSGAPYLFASDDFAHDIIMRAFKHLEYRAREGDRFIAAHPGVYLPSTMSNPYTALLMVDSVMSTEPERIEWDEEEDGPKPSYVVKFSPNAPKLIDIFGPSHDEDGNLIIY